MATSELYGRDAELTELSAFAERIPVNGEARLIRGEPGIGKSALLGATAVLAQRAGLRVLRGSGSEFEADVSYSTLNQLLLAVHNELDRLPPGPRDALAVALGFDAGPSPDPLLICNAALLLVRAVSAEQPVLLLIDDLQWIDRASAVVLSFIVRRLDGTRAGLLASARTGTGHLLDRRGLIEMTVEPLDDTAAAELVGTHFPGMPGRIRRRLLDLAQGNPLALMELPPTLLGAARSPLTGTDVVPLGDRLQAMFTSRITDLPDATRRLLLLATYEGTGDMRILRAAHDGAHGLEDLAPAERAQLVRADDSTSRLAFRHPLIRSAIVALSTHEERRGAHIALAGVLGDDQERRAWHLSAAATGPDEAVAELLEEAARRVMLRGDAFAATSALTRAAELSTTDHGRARRLAEAAYIGAEAGGSTAVARNLLDDARRVTRDAAESLPAANAAAFLILNGDGDVNTAHRLLSGAIEAGDHGYRADDPALVEAMQTLLLLSWYGSAPQYWEPFHRMLARMRPEPPDVLAVAGKTFPDPVRTGAAARPEAEALLQRLPDETDPSRIVRIGTASVYLDRLADSRAPSWRLVEQGREGGSPRRHVGALMHLCLDDFLTGRWDEADELAREGRRICETSGYPFFGWYFHYNLAVVAAGRGRFDEARALADEITHWALPRGVAAAALFAHHPRALAAAGEGRFDLVLRHAAAMSPPGVLASHVPHCTWVMFDLVEAATRIGRSVEAKAHVEAMRAADVAGLSPRMALIQAGADMLVDGDDRVREVLDSPASARWLFDTARVRLAYGERLRRTGSTSEACRQLLLARDGFAAMAAGPWLTRVDGELRAAGHRSSPLLTAPSSPTASAAPSSLTTPAAPSSLTMLTAQEHQIAELAAAGLSNKEIAARLYLSPRTVGSHLYRIFPKLGVTSRAGLRDALSRRSAPH